MFIQTEATPNPATLKFIPGRPVLAQGTLEFLACRVDQGFAPCRAAVRDRWRHRRVLGLRFHQRVEGRGRVAASKARDSRRHHGALSVRRSRSPQSVSAGSESAEEGEFFAPEDAETVNTIKELLETRVRPAVAQDGGDITFQGYRDGIVFLHMRGACSGCPSSTATLRHGIENLLRHFIPEVQEVRPV